MRPQTERVGERALIYRRGEIWWVNLQHRCRQVRKSLKTRNKKEARARALDLERQLLGGHQSRSQTSSTGKPLGISEAADRYIDAKQSEGRATGTRKKYRFVMEQVKQLSLEMRLDELIEIDLAFLDEYRKHRRTGGRKEKTIYNECIVIRQLVLFAKRRGLIPHDPLEGLKLEKPKRTPQPCWTPDEVEEILKAASEPQRAIYTFLAETGVRIGEAQWLTWQDIDLAGRLVHIQPKPGWTTKTGNIRAIPLSDCALEVLSQQPRRAKWVFTAGASSKYPKGDHQISERRLLRSLKRLLKAQKREGHLHTFRHSFISRAAVAGVPEAIIRQWVGHVDEEILRHYIHIADQQSHAAMRHMNGIPQNTGEIQ